MIDAKTIKERIKKWEKMNEEFEKQKEIENEKEIEKEVKKYSKNKINLNPNICQYCKKNKAEKKYVNEETIKLTINSVGFVVGYYEKYQGDIIEIPRCKECYLRQRNNLKKYSIIYYGLTFLITFLLGLLFSGEFLPCAGYGLLCSIVIGTFLFVVNYPKISESLSYSNYVPRVKLKAKGWIVVNSLFNHVFGKLKK